MAAWVQKLQNLWSFLFSDFFAIRLPIELLRQVITCEILEHRMSFILQAHLGNICHS